MDRSNVEKKYLDLTKADWVRTENIVLSEDSTVQINQFVGNNITMANNWLGASGDAFLFSANTISCFLFFALNFFDTNKDLLEEYTLTFNSIDDQLTQIDNINEG